MRRLRAGRNLSIGVAYNRYLSFHHYGRLSEIATEMKHYAKGVTGSCFRIDRRKA